MRVRRIAFSNIRNHESTDVVAADGVNVVTGPNGAGKTTILEAISLCTLTRSFIANPDATLLRRGERSFAARVDAMSDYAVPWRCEVRFDAMAGKSIVVNGAPAVNAAAVIGAAPTVVLSPDLKAITNGAPSERRRFLDVVISQAHRRYLEDLIQYRRILKQRNALLADARRRKLTVDHVLLQAWDEGMIERGARLMAQRTTFVDAFRPLLKIAAGEVSSALEDVELRYIPDGMKGELDSFDAYRDALWLRSRQVWNEEQRRGTTLFGPHRDDLRLDLNGGDVRTSASQGQHKTVLVGLKIAEFHYLASQCAETPIILLDDIFGDLDSRRAERVYDLTRSLAQTFITVTSLELLPFLRGRRLGTGEAHISVVSGTVTEHRSGRRVPTPVASIVTD